MAKMHISNDPSFLYSPILVEKKNKTIAGRRRHLIEKYRNFSWTISLCKDVPLTKFECEESF